MKAQACIHYSIAQRIGPKDAVEWVQGPLNHLSCHKNVAQPKGRFLCCVGEIFKMILLFLLDELWTFFSHALKSCEKVSYNKLKFCELSKY